MRRRSACSSWAYVSRGTTFSHAGDNNRAMVDYTKAIALGPNQALLGGAHFDRGMTYFKMGDYVKAIADFSKAIELAEDFLSDGLLGCVSLLGLIVRQFGAAILSRLLV
jgi:tetratricopeptide (TPR) repeat protein